MAPEATAAIAIMSLACRATLPQRIAVKAAASSASQTTPCAKKPARATAAASPASATTSAPPRARNRARPPPACRHTNGGCATNRPMQVTTAPCACRDRNENKRNTGRHHVQRKCNRPPLQHDYELVRQLQQAKPERDGDER